MARWSLLGTSTNNRGVKFFAIACRDSQDNERDYKELTVALTAKFGAVEAGEMIGPCSAHKYFKVEEFCLGVILDSPDWLDLYARERKDASAVESFIPKILDALNEGVESPAQR